MSDSVQECMEELKKPFPPEEIEFRVQQKIKQDKKALVLPHHNSRVVMDRLDDVLGPNNWQDSYHETLDGLACVLSVRFPGTDEWIQKEDGADPTNIEATKGAYSNALKRAGYKFGIGRYLYHMEEQFVDLKESGDIYAGKSDIRNTTLYFDRPRIPERFLPDDYDGDQDVEQASGIGGGDNSISDDNGSVDPRPSEDQVEYLLDLAEEHDNTPKLLERIEDKYGLGTPIVGASHEARKKQLEENLSKQQVSDMIDKLTS